MRLFLEAGAYTPREFEIIKREYPELWEEYKQKFKQVQKTLDEGPLVKLPSEISALISEKLYPGVQFWGSESEE